MSPLFAMGLLLAALQGGAVTTSIEESFEYQYSDIEGDSAQDIADWFSARQFGGTIGETMTNLSTYYRYEIRGGQCVLTDITAYLTITQTMPRWVDEAEGSRRVRRQWNTFLTNLQTHEDGHVEIARRGAAIVLDRLSQTAPADNCDALGQALDAQSRNLWQRLQTSQRDYDRATEHGLTQGAFIEFNSRR